MKTYFRTAAINSEKFKYKKEIERMKQNTRCKNCRKALKNEKRIRTKKMEFRRST